MFPFHPIREDVEIRGKRKFISSFPLLWWNRKMKEMADSEEQMHVPINPSAWEQQNGKYSGMAGKTATN